MVPAGSQIDESRKKLSSGPWMALASGLATIPPLRCAGDIGVRPQPPADSPPLAQAPAAYETVAGSWSPNVMRGGLPGGSNAWSTRPGIAPPVGDRDVFGVEEATTVLGAAGAEALLGVRRVVAVLVWWDVHEHDAVRLVSGRERRVEELECLRAGPLSSDVTELAARTPMPVPASARRLTASPLVNSRAIAAHAPSARRARSNTRR
jgi:hypothetical protein